jgi:hypothetical protein
MGIVASACAGGPAVPGRPPWDAVALSFLPTTINDSEIIVGTEGGVPVKRSGSGVTTPLPLLGGVRGPYVPVDVNSNGVALGSTSNGDFPGVLWTSSLQAFPLGKAPVGVFVPRAINRSVVVVGGSDDAQQAFRWAPNIIGYSDLPPPPGRSSARATDVNDAGHAVGTAWHLSSQLAVVRWTGDTPAVLATPPTGMRGGPFIRNSGDVTWAEIGVIKTWNGVTTTVPSPAGFEMLIGVSEPGRFIGTLVSAGGEKRGWTSFKGGTAFLDPPAAQPGDYFEPKSVNSCGSIVGVVHRANGTTSGLLFAKSFRCDVSPPIVTQ